MRVIYPKELEDLRKSIPNEYRKHPETAPKEYRERFELWLEKSRQFDKELREELFGF